MEAMEPDELVGIYLAAVARRDFETARGCLADRAFSYVSPISRFEDADAFIASLEGVGAILQRVESRHRFSSGNEVCHFLDVTTSIGAYRTQSVALFARVISGRISRMEVIFDATEFNRMIGSDPAG